jgi:hypothetical protein
MGRPCAHFQHINLFTRNTGDPGGKAMHPMTLSASPKAASAQSTEWMREKGQIMGEVGEAALQKDHQISCILLFSSLYWSKDINQTTNTQCSSDRP